MQHTKLIQLLKCFSEKEIKQFDSFLQSPYFNKNEILVTFYRQLSSYHPEMESGKLAKEKVFTKLFGKIPYDDKRMRDLTSETFKLAKLFLPQEELRKDDIQSSHLRYKWLFRNNLKKMAAAELDNLGSVLNKYESHDFQYYHHQWQFDLHKFETAADQFRSLENKLLKEFDVLAHVHSLNRVYLINSFMSLSYLLAASNIYKFSLDDTFLGQIEALAGGYINQGDTVIDILYNIFQLARIDDEKYFFELKARFLSNDPSVPKEVMAAAGMTLENYTAKKLREGKIQFVAEVMQVYHFECENNLHLDNGKLNYIRYFNIVTRGMEIPEEHDWVDHFVEDCKKDLADEFREDAYYYAKAHVLFARKQFKESLRMALSCNIKFFIAKIIIRMLVARTQYELGMMDELQAELDTFRYHLKDETLTDDRRLHLQTFITTMRQLIDLRASYTEGKALHLTKTVTTQEGMPNQEWFQKRVNDLMDRKSKKNTDHQ